MPNHKLHLPHIKAYPAARCTVQAVQAGHLGQQSKCVEESEHAVKAQPWWRLRVHAKVLSPASFIPAYDLSCNPPSSKRMAQYTHTMSIQADPSSCTLVNCGYPNLLGQGLHRSDECILQRDLRGVSSNLSENILFLSGNGQMTTRDGPELRRWHLYADAMTWTFKLLP